MKHRQVHLNSVSDLDLFSVNLITLDLGNPSPVLTRRSTSRVRVPANRALVQLEQIINSTPHTRRREHQPEPLSPGEAFQFEDEPMPETPRQTSRRTPRQTPRQTPHQTPRSTIRLHPSNITTPVHSIPRSGPHSPERAIQQRRSPKKRSARAKDVWEFMKQLDTKERVCLLCR